MKEGYQLGVLDRNLREVIRPEIVRLVKEQVERDGVGDSTFINKGFSDAQRIAFLVKGTHFHTYSAGRPRKGIEFGSLTFSYVVLTIRKFLVLSTLAEYQVFALRRSGREYAAVS